MYTYVCIHKYVYPIATNRFMDKCVHVNMQTRDMFPLRFHMANGSCRWSHWLSGAVSLVSLAARAALRQRWLLNHI